MEQSLRATAQSLSNAKSELDATKRRAERERGEAKKYGAERALKEFLGVYDNMERALQHSGEARNTPLGQGVEMTLQQFVGSLKRLGAEQVEAGPGVVFDPNVHEAVGQSASDEVEPGAIVLVMQGGFMLHDRLLRAAMVNVSAGPGPAAKPGPKKRTKSGSRTRTSKSIPPPLDPAGGAGIEVTIDPKAKPKKKKKRKRTGRTSKGVSAHAVAAAKEMAVQADGGAAPWETDGDASPATTRSSAKQPAGRKK